MGVCGILGVLILGRSIVRLMAVPVNQRNWALGRTQVMPEPVYRSDTVELAVLQARPRAGSRPIAGRLDDPAVRR